MSAWLKRMKTNHFSLILLLCCLEVSAQPLQKEYSILFYNVENLFDVKNDSLSNDDAFTPEGDRRWTYNRMEKKILDISKVIISSCGWDTPTLVALCEIENRYVIERLQQSEHLHQIPYRIIHKESPDHRGIDIGLLYNTTLFNPLKYEY